MLSSVVEPVFFLTGSGTSSKKKEAFNYLYKVCLTTPHPPHQKKSVIFKDLFFNLPIINVGTKRLAFRIFLFHLNWSRSRPFKSAPVPAKISGLRLCNTDAVSATAFAGLGRDKGALAYSTGVSIAMFIHLLH